jgi:uncharacterized protein
VPQFLNSGSGMTDRDRVAAKRLRPEPVPSPESLPFWHAARTHRLVLPRCLACGQFWFPPSCLCPHCQATTYTWEEVSGRGRVHSFVVVHRVSDPAFAAAVPYVPAVIELEEGPRLLSDIVAGAPGRLYCGMPVSVLFEDISADYSLPRFAPAPQGGAAQNHAL